MAPRTRTRLGEVVLRTRKDAGLEQGELAAKANTTQPRISDFEHGSEQFERFLETLAAIDVACGHRPGHVLRVAGYVAPDTADMDAAIEAADIDPLDKDALRALYNVMRQRRAAELQEDARAAIAADEKAAFEKRLEAKAGSPEAESSKRRPRSAS